MHKGKPSDIKEATDICTVGHLYMTPSVTDRKAGTR